MSQKKVPPGTQAMITTIEYNRLLQSFLTRNILKLPSKALDQMWLYVRNEIAQYNEVQGVGGWLASTAVSALQSVPCDSRAGGTGPANYPVYSNCHSSAHNEHDVCFHLPGRQNGSFKIRYFNGPTIDRDVSQHEGLKCGWDPQRSCSHIHGWGEVL
jgi:hypothetical protein